MNVGLTNGKKNVKQLNNVQVGIGLDRAQKTMRVALNLIRVKFKYSNAATVGVREAIGALAVIANSFPVKVSDGIAGSGIIQSRAYSGLACRQTGNESIAVV